MPPAPSGAALVDDPLEHERFTRWVAGAQGERLGESALQLAGMTCAACAGLIEQALLRVDGVRAATVSAAGQRATVRWDPARTQPSALIAAVRHAGYDAVPDAAAPARALRQAEHREALWRLFVAAFCMMQVMMFATPSYVAGPGELEPDLAQLLNWGSWVLSLPVLLFAAAPFLRGAWHSARSRRIGMDVPVSIGLIVAFVASTGATFDPNGVFGHEVYFDSLTMFVAFLLGARYLELKARHRAAEGLEQALARMPEAAERQTDEGTWETVSTLRLREGDVLRVAVGQAFPADGVLLEGSTVADESLLTGESTGVAKTPGCDLAGGSVNLLAPVVMKASRVGADTRFEAIVSMMRDAMTQRPAAARVADRWAGPFLWAVLVLAAAAALMWSHLDPSRALWVFVAVLIVTCPCALSLAAPMTLVAAAGGLARRGIVVQRLDALETLASVRRLFVDKTGTLTEDRAQLQNVHLLSAALPDAAAALAVGASLAAWSRHPLSQALAAALPDTGRTPWRDVREQPGCGLQAFDAQGTEWRLGSSAWAGEGAGCETQAEGPCVWLSRGRRVVARFDFEEALRPGSAEAMAAWRADGVHVTLLSGDDAQRSARLAERLHLDASLGGATPEDKLRAVAEAQRDGTPVAMVGDGVNDAPVLARADVSLAMGQGALVSRAQADAVIVSNRPADLWRTRVVARRAMRIVRQNLTWAAVYNASCIPLALAGWLPPWAAGLGMALSSLVVVGNAMRASRV